MGEALWHREGNWVGSDIEDAFVMMNIDTGKYVALNRTANAIWQVLQNPARPSEIETQLIDTFVVQPQDCHRAVATLLAQMQELHMASPK